MIRTLVGVLLLLILSACGQQEGPSLHQFGGQTMGTSYHVKLFAEQLTGDRKVAIRDGIAKALSLVDDRMSNYKQTSDITRVNQAAVGSAVKVSREFVDVLKASRSLSLLSNGSFDVTVSPLIELWGFGTRNQDNPPTQAQLETVLKKVGMTGLGIDQDKGLITKQADITLNVSAIAKGFGVDQVARFLDQQKIDSYLIEVGGEIFARGRKPGGHPWVLGVETPDVPTREAFLTLRVQDAGLATSGDYRNFIEVDGVKYSHTIDPKNGKPVMHRLASVSVLHDSCMLADGLATTLMVLGEIEGKAFAEQEGLDALFVVRGEAGFDYFTTGNFGSKLIKR